MDTMEVPDITPGYPSKGKKLGPAWRAMWECLAASGTDFTDGKALATEVAKKHKLVPATLQAVLARAAVAGLLESDRLFVSATVRHPVSRKQYEGHRVRVHYRVACPECKEYAGTGGENITCATCGKPGLDLL